LAIILYGSTYFFLSIIQIKKIIYFYIFKWLCAGLIVVTCVLGKFCVHVLLYVSYVYVYWFKYHIIYRPQTTGIIRFIIVYKLTRHKMTRCVTAGMKLIVSILYIIILWKYIKLLYWHNSFGDTSYRWKLLLQPFQIIYPKKICVVCNSSTLRITAPSIFIHQVVFNLAPLFNLIGNKIVQNSKKKCLI